MERLRPLTPEEQLFAAQNHNLIYTFLREKGLSEDEFYDVVIFGYMRAVQDYLSGPRFRAYAFSTIAWKRMQHSVSNYCRYLAAPIRSAVTVSLYSPPGSEKDRTWEDVLNRPDDLFLRFETRSLLDVLEGKLSPREMKIIRMKLAGYKMHEIAGREHLTFQEINELLTGCREEILRVLWGDAEETAA